ncbi:MAG: DUF4249 domain-containing protein [Saprospiraceae bacterium]|nr:DUF4249 domain-containing protein [Saprospiraceae bacterium]
MKNILIIFCLSAIALTSCESFFSQTVEIDPPAYDKQLSLHLNLTDRDTAVNLVLSRNYGILEYVDDEEDYYVKGGAVQVLKNGQPWLELHPVNADSSFYFSGILPEPFQIGQTYELRATHPNFPEVRATQVVPGDFQADSARVKRQSASGPFGEQYDLVEVYLKDPAGVKNYYEITMYGIYYWVVQNPNTNELDTLDVGYYPIFADQYSDPAVQEGYEGGALFSDQFFEGQAYKFQAQVYSNGDLQYFIRIKNVTEDYFKWSRSYQDKRDSEENFLAEPVSVFHNLENGLGIFTVAKERVLIAQ